jgi:hypothetical protein
VYPSQEEAAAADPEGATAQKKKKQSKWAVRTIIHGFMEVQVDGDKQHSWMLAVQVGGEKEPFPTQRRRIHGRLASRVHV